MTTQRTRDSRRYYAAQYWHYRLRGHASRTLGARLAYLGRAGMYRIHWRDLWAKRKVMA